MAPTRASDAKLDELLGEVGRLAPAGPAALAGAGSFQTLAASAVFYTLRRAVGVAPSFPLVFAVAAGAALIRVATGQLREPRRRRTRDIVRGRPRRPRRARAGPGRWHAGGGPAVGPAARSGPRRG
jgi:hypothetical protein